MSACNPVDFPPFFWLGLRRLVFLTWQLERPSHPNHRNCLDVIVWIKGAVLLQLSILTTVLNTQVNKELLNPPSLVLPYQGCLQVLLS